MPVDMQYVATERITHRRWITYHIYTQKHVTGEKNTHIQAYNTLDAIYLV